MNLNSMGDQVLLKELLQKEKEYLNSFFDQLDTRPMEELVSLMKSCEGVIFFTGVGKSGLVAKKIAMTMTSTGTRSLYISPMDALHGDIGIVTEKDIFVLLSKSGESDELMNLLPILRNKHVRMVAVVSNPESRLAKGCDFHVVLPVEKELCPFDMAPTISTTAQLIFGDVLAITLMRQKNFSQDQFAENHPAGRLGKRITMKVQDIMIKGSSIPVCGPHDKLVEVLVELSNKRCGCVLVIDQEKQLQGIFTDGDLRRALQNRGEKVLDTAMGELMTCGAKWIAPNRLAWEAMREMEGDHKKAITVMPVLEEGKKVVGLIKLHDILQTGI